MHKFSVFFFYSGADPGFSLGGGGGGAKDDVCTRTSLAQSPMSHGRGLLMLSRAI